MRWMLGPGYAGVGVFGALVARSLLLGTPWWAAMAFNVVLALAVLPLAGLATRGGRLRPGWAVAWLLMWPNALYLVTDLAHLHGRSPDSLWPDVASYGALAVCGVWIGVATLLRVVDVVRGQLGPAAAAGSFATLCAAGGFGIWLGRVKRLNSWDVVTHPERLVTSLRDVLHDPGQLEQAAVFVGLWGGGMAFVAACAALSRTTPTPLSTAARPSSPLAGRRRVPAPGGSTR